MQYQTFYYASPCSVQTYMPSWNAQRVWHFSAFIKLVMWHYQLSRKKNISNLAQFKFVHCLATIWHYGSSGHWQSQSPFRWLNFLKRENWFLFSLLNYSQICFPIHYNAEAIHHKSLVNEAHRMQNPRCSIHVLV